MLFSYHFTARRVENAAAPNIQGGKKGVKTMALFKRADHKAQGLTDDQIEFVMTEGNRSLANNYTLTSDVQGKIDAAVEAAKTAPVDITKSAEYQKLAQERDMEEDISAQYEEHMLEIIGAV